MAELIDGKAISQSIKDEIKEKTAKLGEKGIKPCLAVILCGDDPASTVYVANKKKACEYCGFDSISLELPGTTTQEELLKKIDEFNKDDKVNGILVQLPLPSHISEDAVIAAIAPEKDVDGFNAVSVGNLLIGRPGFVSCTPAGVIQLLKRSGVEIAGKECVVIGRSNIVGKPMSVLMLRENATVTTCHSRTKNLKEVCRRADILIVAIGKPKMIDASYVKEGAVVIDVGIHRLEGKKLCGDVDFDSVEKVASKITSVPGGVGPMTIAMLMNNCLEGCMRQNGLLNE
jgi:methylenetetrahydrofolate dehydrogenase (NADP+)/methenyltetrahydrofolate cyclohydrolase